MKNAGFRYADRYYTELCLTDSSHASATRIALSVALVGSQKCVLDVGCYDGHIAELILRKGNEVHGIDASLKVVKQAQKRGVKAVVSDLSNTFPYEDNTFDTVYAGEIIEHILDTDFFIDEIKRVLKKNGTLIITTPNTASFARRLMLLFNVNPFFEASYGYPKNATAGHIRFFIIPLLKGFLSYKRLCVEQCFSDIINFPFGVKSQFLAKIFPSLGQSIIIKAKVAEE